MRKYFAVLGAVVGSLLLVPGAALAHDGAGTVACPVNGAGGVVVSFTGFADKPGNVVLVHVKRDGAPFVDQFVNFNGPSGGPIKVADPSSDGTPHTYTVGAEWNTNGHSSGGVRELVGATLLTCGTYVPPTQPPVTPTPPPSSRICYSRRDFRVRVSRKYNHQFKAGYVVTDAGRVFNMHLRKSGRLSGRINWRGVPGTKHQIRYFAFFLQRNDGSWTSGKRRARLCTPRRQAHPPTLNLNIGVRVPYRTYVVGSNL